LHDEPARTRCALRAAERTRSRKVGRIVTRVSDGGPDAWVDTLRLRWPPPRHQSRRRSALRRSATSSSCSRTTFDPAGLSRRVAELEGQMGEPGFWDDQAAAAKVSAEHARTARKVESFARLQADVDDLEGLV